MTSASRQYIIFLRSVTVQCLSECYIDVFMALLGGPIEDNRPSRSATFSAKNSLLRAYAWARDLSVLHCTRQKVRTLHLVQFEFLT